MENFLLVLFCPPLVWYHCGIPPFSCQCIYSTSRKSLNKCLASGRVLRLCPPPHWTCVRLRASACVHVRLRASACVHARCVRVRKYIHVCVRVRASSSACEHLRPRACVCVCVHASAFVCVQTIKSPDASRRKWISASRRVFCSRTFGMYYSATSPYHLYW